VKANIRQKPQLDFPRDRQSGRGTADPGRTGATHSPSDPNRVVQRDPFSNSNNQTDTGGERFLDRQEVQVALQDLRTTARRAPDRPFVEHLTDLATDAETLAEERREHVDALVRLGHEYLEADGGRGSLDGFLEFLSTTLRGDDAAGGSESAGVELLTFHRAKGLEFDTVFVTGLERGLVPISHAKSNEALDEEQRLLYVALSRAERALHLSWAEERTVGGRVARRTRSTWVNRVEDALHPPASGQARKSDSARESIASARDRVSRAKGGSTRIRVPTDVAETDTPLYDALVEWRLRQSRAASAPAYVIFPNTTLAAIATARPRSARALLDVPGVGPVKAERYGEAVLALVAEHSS